MTRSDGYLTTADGTRLYFERLGTGESTVVIPNGLYLAGDFSHLPEKRTLIVYDPRNRGRSDTVTDATSLARGIVQDVDDLEAVRRHFDLPRLNLIGHSYIGLLVILYAMTHPSRVGRIVQIGPPPPSQNTQYPPELMNDDGTLREVFGKIGALQPERASLSPEEFCRRAWTFLRAIYVVNPADGHRADWGRCELANERNMMQYWMKYLLPSIERLELTADDMAKVTMPVLTVHGRRDRSAPYGGGRDWALALPDARLVTIDNAAHAPWIEAPAAVFGAIDTFLDGAWPPAAERVTSLTPSP